MSDHNDDAELEQDVLKLQIHSIPLNLNWNQDEEEFDDESEDGMLKLQINILYWSNFSFAVFLLIVIPVLVWCETQLNTFMLWCEIFYIVIILYYDFDVFASTNFF